MAGESPDDAQATPRWGLALSIGLVHFDDDFRNFSPTATWRLAIPACQGHTGAYEHTPALSALHGKSGLHSKDFYGVSSASIVLVRLINRTRRASSFR